MYVKRPSTTTTATSYVCILHTEHKSEQNQTGMPFFHHASVQLLYGCTANTLHYPTRGRKQARRGNMMDWHITPRLRTLLRILYLVFGVLHSSIHFGVKMCTCNIYYALQDQCTLVHTILFKSWGRMHALKIEPIHSWSYGNQVNLLWVLILGLPNTPVTTLKVLIYSLWLEYREELVAFDEIACYHNTRRKYCKRSAKWSQRHAVYNTIAHIFLWCLHIVQQR
jgi:hypothetical protein